MLPVPVAQYIKDTIRYTFMGFSTHLTGEQSTTTDCRTLILEFQNS